MQDKYVYFFRIQFARISPAHDDRSKKRDTGNLFSDAFL